MADYSCLFPLGFSRASSPLTTVATPEDFADAERWHPFSRLRGFDASCSILFDGMHTICGVLKGLWKLMQGVKKNGIENVIAHEKKINKRSFETMHIAGREIPAVEKYATLIDHSIPKAKKTKNG